MSPKKILVLCTGNSCRSQMAEAYLQQFAGDRATVYSAGIEAHGLNPRAVKSMNEDGVDISAKRSKTIDEFQGQRFDFVITVCDHAREQCPWIPGAANYLHRDFPDPAKAQGTEVQVMSVFRKVREEIKSFSRQFVAEHL
ncbi:MAG TPA: arsenate reductase ArsC [Chitinophagaceae bacterium]|nr:arsenate reductase ArsC [Chitinophagaceae bacterium]